MKPHVCFFKKALHELFFKGVEGAPEYFPQQFLRHDPNRYLKGNRTGTCVQCASKLKQTSQTFSVTPGAVQSNSHFKFVFHFKFFLTYFEKHDSSMFEL